MAIVANPASAQTHDIGKVFRDFETVCFSYAETGYGLDLTFIIEEAGFKPAGKALDGADVFNSDDVQLIIGDKFCALGMQQLPFGQMLDWTKQWIDAKGLAYARLTTSRTGGQFWVWRGSGFEVGLEEDKLPDGTPLTGLVLIKK